MTRKFYKFFLCPILFKSTDPVLYANVFNKTIMFMLTGIPSTQSTVQANYRNIKQDKRQTVVSKV